MQCTNEKVLKSDGNDLDKKNIQKYFSNPKKKKDFDKQQRI